MRNTLLSLGAGALLCVATSVGAGAAPLSAPAGARVALQDLGAVESVHCIPGVVHGHRWGVGHRMLPAARFLWRAAVLRPSLSRLSELRLPARLGRSQALALNAR
jgi:hypothetical protein